MQTFWHKTYLVTDNYKKNKKSKRLREHKRQGQLTYLLFSGSIQTGKIKFLHFLFGYWIH